MESIILILTVDCDVLLNLCMIVATAGKCFFTEDCLVLSSYKYLIFCVSYYSGVHAVIIHHELHVSSAGGHNNWHSNRLFFPSVCIKTCYLPCNVVQHAEKKS